MLIASTADRPSPLKIGLGVTAMERAIQSNGHLDGIGTYTAELLKHFDKEAVALHKFAFKGFRGTEIGDDVEAMPGSFQRNLIKGALFGIPFPGDRALGARFDLFHAPDHHVPKLRHIPVLASIMDPVPLMAPEWTATRMRAAKNWFFRRSVQWADHFVTISHFVVDDIVEHFQIPRDRISVIELGVDDRYFTPLPDSIRESVMAELKIQGDFFLFIGTLQPRKNLLRLIEAFNRLPLDMRRGCPLIVAGREGWSSEPDRSALAKLAAEGTGRWLDYVTPLQKFALLQSARALVFPTLYEGFGLPVLEAFASGLPVIASNTTSIPEVAGDAALLVNPLNVEELADAMRRVSEDSELRQTLRDAGKIRSRSFTWKRTADRTTALYRTMLGKD